MSDRCVTASGKVAVVGSINADMRVGVERFPGPGETLAGGEATLTPGGTGAPRGGTLRSPGGDGWCCRERPDG